MPITTGKIIFPDGDSDSAVSIGQEGFDRLNALGEFTLFTDTPKNQDAFIARVRKAEAMLLGWDIPGEVLKEARHLKHISFTGTGAAKFIDLELASELGVSVSNCPGYGDNAVAEHAMALMFGLCRQLHLADQTTKSGQWEHSGKLMELSGKTLGVVGFGGIARRVAALAQGIGMQVIVWTRNPSSYQNDFPDIRFVTLDNLLSDADVVSLHLAHTPETENLINAEALSAMKSGALLINTARGELVDENALITALQGGNLGGAGLDVFCEEPLSAEHGLVTCPNTLLTPHLAFQTPEATKALHRIAIDNIEQFYAGTPINLVTQT